MQRKHNVPLSSLTTFQNEGIVQEVVIVENEAELCEWLHKGETFYILGKGSNTVINPNGKIQRFLQISPQWCDPSVTGNLLTVGAGTTVNTLMKLLVTHGLSGLEFSAGVPASVGGMVAMNFGCWGQEISDTVIQVKVVSKEGQSQWLSKKDCEFGYRTSRFQSQNEIITEVQFQLEQQDPNIIKSNQRHFIDQRLAKQPLREKTFGSTFKNPSGYFAGALIEQIGFKGKPVGAVMFSTRHANFLVNGGGGTFQEVETLIKTVQEKVSEQFQIQLETEVKLVQ